MKKYFYSLLTMLTAIFALSSCEDVPAPYDLPIFGGDDSTTIEPTGSGTADDPFNVAAAIEKCKEVGTTLSTEVYYVKGIVKTVDTSGASQYGNITIDMIDEGGSDVFKAFQILGIGGKKFTEETASSIQEGDVVIVMGKIYNYNGNTPETESKGAAQLVSVNGEGSSQPDAPAVTPTGTGTFEDPFNVAAAIAKCKETGETTTTEEYYVKGIVESVNETGIAQYGNINVDMVDIEGSSAVFTAFQIVSFNGAKFTEAGTVKKGDVIIVKGKLVNYKNNTPETEGKGASQLISINGQTGPQEPEVTPGTPAGAGTAADPFNVAAAVKKCQETGETATADQYYVKGIVESVNSTGVDQYGNISINMVDVAGSSEVFMAFQVNSINGEKFTSETAAGIKKGDVVVVKGNLVNYKGNTPETTGKGAGCVISVNGKTTIEPGSATGGNTGGGTAGDFATTVSYTLGANAYDDGVATVNGVENVKILKIGTSKAAGDITLSLPAGKTTFYAVTWKGTASADVKIGDVKTVTVKGNDGAASNSPYTISVTDADKYEISVDAATTVTVTSDKRILFFGIQQAK